ncbi:MAG: leucine-rich repeat domain-containing protein [Oscillospiraceae bacterium]|nr:leucine-rich repeat domain-containing protein [Oscillospiraceae bacterium]
MKSNKKLAILTSSLVLVAGMGIGANLHKIALAPSMTISADDVIYQGFKYTKTEDGITITGYTEELDLENLVIPDEIDGTPVTAIGNSAFTNCFAIKKLTLGKNLRTIGAKAFFSSKSNANFEISELVIPDNLESIDTTAFGSSYSSRIARIQSLVIPASTTYVNPYFYQSTVLSSFSVADGNKNYSSDEHGVLFNADKTTLIRCPGATEMTSYVVPDSVTEIGASAFYDANSITSLNLGKNVTTVGEKAFYGKDEATKHIFKEFIVSDNLKNFGDNAFGGYLDKYCPSIENLTIPASATYVDAILYNNSSVVKFSVGEGNTAYSNDEYGVLFNADKTKLVRCPANTAMTSYVVPDSVTEIGNSAFYDANAITSLDLGKNVTIIGEKAFYGRDDSSKHIFESFTIPDNVKTIGQNALGGYLDKYAISINNLIVPASAKYVDPVFYNNSSISKFTVEEGCAAYSNDEHGVLFNADKTKLIRCPANTAMTSYVVPDSVTEISDMAFYDSNTITSLNLGKNVITIGEKVFYGSDDSSKHKFTEFTVPDAATTIGKNAFGGYLDKYAISIEHVIVPASAKSVDSTIYNNPYISKFTVEEGCTAYSNDEHGVLFNADKTKLVRCPANTAMTSYIVPDSVTEISDMAFYDANTITELNMGKNVLILGDKVFYGSNDASKFNFTKLTIPDDLRVIGNYAFGGYLEKYAPVLTNIVVPASAKYVDSTIYNNKTIMEINVDTENPKYLSDYGVLYNQEEATLLRCPQASSLLEYEILETTKIISDSAFAGTKLQVVTIHPSVYIIGKKVFSDSLNVVKGYPDTLAENYALENKYTFLPVDTTVNPEPPEDPDEPGTKEPDYDLNGDGKINVMDLLKIKKYLLLG